MELKAQHGQNNNVFLSDLRIMKLKLLHKVFLANFLVIGLLSAVLLSVSYFSFKAMSTYIDESAYREDEYMVSNIAIRLGDFYDKNQSWQSLERDHRHWRRIIENVIRTDRFSSLEDEQRARGPAQHRQAPSADKRGPRGPARQHTPPSSSDKRPPRDKHRSILPPFIDDNTVPLPHFRRPQLISRIELLDENKNIIISAKKSADIQHYVPIYSDKAIVGWLGLVKAIPAEQHGDVLMRHQLERVVFMALIGLLLSSIVSFYLARHFVAPIRKLIQGAIELSERNFETKIDIASNDEFAELAHYFNDIGVRLSKFEVQQKQWLQDIAHELRTPLTVIRGELEAMVDGVTEPTKYNLVLLQHDVLRLNHLINDLHELSVTDDLTLNRDYGVIEFNKTCLNTAKRFQSKLKNRGIGLVTDFQPGNARGDEGRIIQVLDNLLHNCHKYTEQNGTVWFSCRVIGNNVTLNIEDSGPGVQPRKLSKLFDRLYRVDAHRSRDTGGAGLGLAICKNIIVAHNGTIEANIGGHGGLKITITIPSQ